MVWRIFCTALRFFFGLSADEHGARGLQNAVALSLHCFVPSPCCRQDFRTPHFPAVGVVASYRPGRKGSAALRFCGGYFGAAPADGLVRLRSRNRRGHHGGPRDNGGGLLFVWLLGSPPEWGGLASRALGGQGAKTFRFPYAKEKRERDKKRSKYN